MELAKGIMIPVLADNVLTPNLYYGIPYTGIYFRTDDGQYGRITFKNLDAIKICRGEILPFDDDWEIEKEITWVYKVENSKWLIERFNYENENYGSSYEFGRNVEEMLTDYSHFVFTFNDQFIEAIAKGFWFEKDTNSLFNRELLIGHPFLPLREINFTKFETQGINYKVIYNPLDTEKLIQNTIYCSQKLIEFAIEIEGEFSVSHTLIIMQRQERLLSVLDQFYGQPLFEKEGIVSFEEVKPIIEKYIGEVAERRRLTS